MCCCDCDREQKWIPRNIKKILSTAAGYIPDLDFFVPAGTSPQSRCLRRRSGRSDSENFLSATAGNIPEVHFFQPAGTSTRSRCPRAPRRSRSSLIEPLAPFSACFAIGRCPPPIAGFLGLKNKLSLQGLAGEVLTICKRGWTLAVRGKRGSSLAVYHSFGTSRYVVTVFTGGRQCPRP